MKVVHVFRRHPWTAISIIVAGWAAILLLHRAWFEAQGSLHDDVFTYLAVGRGILNGLTPYVDLFESKPPGIFLLSALSIQLFDGPLLLKALQIAALFIIPSSAALLAWIELCKGDTWERRAWIMLAFTVGTLLTLHAFAASGEGLVEPLGAALCAMFAVLYAYVKDRPAHVQKGMLALLMIGAIGLKEPFILVLIAIAFLLGRSKEHVLHGFLIPLSSAIIAGLVLLFAFGLWHPYFSIYLPHMLGYHVNQLAQWNGNFFIRGLMVHRTVANMWYFSPFLCTLMISVFFSNIYGILRNNPRPHASLMRLMLFLLSSYLLFLAVGAGGDFYAHHFVFFTVGWIVLFTLFLQTSCSMSSRIAHVVKIMILVLAIASLAWYGIPNFEGYLRDWRKHKTELVHAANVLDEVMDRCAWTKYLQLSMKGAGPFGYSHHSPYGPIFIQFNRFMDGNPMYRERFREALLAAPIIVVHEEAKTNLAQTAVDYVRASFSATPPPCAEPFVQPEPYRMLFRT